MVTVGTLVLQTFQNALFLYELFPSLAGMIEWLIILPLWQKCLLSPSVTDWGKIEESRGSQKNLKQKSLRMSYFRVRSKYALLPLAVE